MASSPVDSKVFEAIKELVVTEYKYLRSLKTMQDLFARPLSPSFVSPFHIMGSQEGGGGGDGEGDGHSPPALSHHDWHLMFSKIPQLISLHESILECFMQGLDIHHHHGEDAESRGDNVALDFSVIRFSSNGISLGELGNVFLKHVPLLDIYVSFCESQMLVLRRLQELRVYNFDFDLFLKTTTSSNPRCKGLDLSAFFLEPMQRLTRYPLLIKQILHHSKVENSRRDSFKKADISSILNSLETQIVITECNPFSELIGSEAEKRANPFSEISMHENPFNSNLSLTSGTPALVAALVEIESILSRANEAAQRRENAFKLSQLQSQLGGNKILLTNGQLRSPTLLQPRGKRRTSTASSRSPSRPNGGEYVISSSLNSMTLFHREIIDLPSETKHHEPRIWIKDGILEDCSCSPKEPIYCVLCSDLILLLHFEPRSLGGRVTSESKLSLAYKPISLLDVAVDVSVGEPKLMNRFRNSLLSFSKPVVTQNCKFALRSRSNAPLLLPSSSSSSSFGSDFFPKQKGGGGTIVTLRTSSESERRQWVNVISEAIFNFKNKEALESSNTMAGFTPSSHSFVHVGNLVLKLERASELLPVDRGITSHPYCVIRWNECVLKSRVIPNTINPAWDEDFELQVYDSLDRILSIQLYNYRKYSKNEYLGRAEIDLSFLKYYEGDQTETIPIHLADVPTGTLFVKLIYERISFVL